MSIFVPGALVIEVTITGSTPDPWSPDAETSYTTADGDHHLEAPAIQFRVGRGVFRAADLSAGRTAAIDRPEATFKATKRGKVLHLILQTFKAGAPFSPVMAVAEAKQTDAHRLGVGDS
jgi:hypothetical protein